MKKIVICLLTICIAMPAMAIAECNVKFEWVPQVNNEDIAGYLIFCREKGKEYDYDNPIWQGDNTFIKCTIDDLDESKTYYFVIRSVDQYDNQSYDSPEVEFTYNSSNADDDSGSDAGLGGDGQISTSTSFSSCFIQTLSRSSSK